MRLRVALACGLLLAALNVTAQVISPTDGTIRLYPANPSAGEDFMVVYRGARGGSPSYAYNGSALVTGKDVQMRATIGGSDFSVPSYYYANAAARIDESGTYRLLFAYGDRFGYTPATFVGTFNVGPAIAASAPQYRNLSGTWYAADKPGSGVNLAQGDSGALFAVWLTYIDRPYNSPESSNSLWLVMSNGKWISPTVFRGLIHQTRGTPYNRVYKSLDNGLDTFGLMTLTFVSATEMDFEVDTFLQGAAFQARFRVQRTPF